MNLPVVSEDFVQFVWKFTLFNQLNLTLNNGDRIQIIHPGTQNFAGGPDFFNAKIYIQETLWAGNVEIHLSVKNWHQHAHSLDAAYNNVILHVVYFNETESVQLKNGRFAPTLSIGNLIFENTLFNYKLLVQEEKSFIPCQRFMPNIEAFTFTQFYQTLLFERLERKVKDIEADLSYAQGDLDMAFIVNLLKYFGAPKNKDVFALLARSFSFSQLIKQNLGVVQLESFLFGLANLLNNQDDYAKKLQNEFEYTKKLFNLEVHCKATQWNFAGVRPPNFPTIRIAQLAALLSKNIRLFSSLLELESLEAIKLQFKVSCSPYWQTHYNFGKESRTLEKSISNSFINKLLINVVIPFLFFYGKYVNEEIYINRALSFLEDIEGESNQIIKSFKKLGAPCKSAFDSQALIELKNSYCNVKKCLDCRLAYSILK